MTHVDRRFPLLRSLASDFLRRSVLGFIGIAAAIVLLIVSALGDSDFVLPVIAGIVAALTAVLFEAANTRRRRERANERRVFIAHQQDDKGTARRVQKIVREFGYDAWLVEDELEPGDIWKVRLDNSIRTSGAVLVILPSGSQHGTESISSEVETANKLVVAPNYRANPILPIVQTGGDVPWDKLPSLLGHVEAIHLDDAEWPSELLQYLSTVFDRSARPGTLGRIAHRAA